MTVPAQPGSAQSLSSSPLPNRTVVLTVAAITIGAVAMGISTLVTRDSARIGGHRATVIFLPHSERSLEFVVVTAGGVKAAADARRILQTVTLTS